MEGQVKFIADDIMNLSIQRKMGKSAEWKINSNSRRQPEVPKENSNRSFITSNNKIRDNICQGKQRPEEFSSSGTERRDLQKVIKVTAGCKCYAKSIG